MTIKEAYNIKELTEELKALGLDVAEDTAAKVLDLVLEWVKESATKSSTPYDDLVATIFPLLKQEVLKHIDKIDGKEG